MAKANLRCMTRNIFKLGIVLAAVISCWILSPSSVSAQDISEGKIAIIGGDYRSIIYTVNPDGTDLKTLLKIPDGVNEQFSNVEWSPDFRHLLVTIDIGPRQNHENRYNVYLINADGTNLQPLKDVEYFTAKWSPDSQHLAYLHYIEWQNRYDGLFVASADGSNAKRFLDRPVVSYAWSPDSKQLALASLGDIYTASLSDHNNLSRLAVNAIEPNQVAWSPDKDYISYVVDNSLFDVHIADKKTTKLVKLRKWLYGTYSWTPNKQQIAFLNHSFDNSLEFISADGTNRQSINVAAPVSLSQSPTANKILSRMIYDPTFGTDYEIIDYEHAISIQLGKTLGVDIAGPYETGETAVWSPDGNHIAFISRVANTQETICISDSDGTHKQCLENTSKVKPLIALAWQPNVIQ